MSPIKLATSRIYLQKKLNEMKEHLRFPVERQSIANNVVRCITGKDELSGGLLITRLLSAEALKKIAERAIG
ncbi:hypothetical protein M0802_011317 [Mischocyttarus mexicanus]|nr:hypothetical protein M0802_011317 [Mischocyttarus mexicanus]